MRTRQRARAEVNAGRKLCHRASVGLHHYRTAARQCHRGRCPPRHLPSWLYDGRAEAAHCEIIDQLETGPRGVYSGVVGYLGFNGQSDLSVVIRTAVRAAGEITIGAGGAIVLDSDPAAELEERNLKAQSVLGAWQ